MSIGLLYVIVIYYINNFYISKSAGLKISRLCWENHYLIQTEAMWKTNWMTNITLVNDSCIKGQ